MSTREDGLGTQTRFNERIRLDRGCSRAERPETVGKLARRVRNGPAERARDEEQPNLDTAVGACLNEQQVCAVVD